MLNPSRPWMEIYLQRLLLTIFLIDNLSLLREVSGAIESSDVFRRFILWLPLVGIYLHWDLLVILGFGFVQVS